MADKPAAAEASKKANLQVEALRKNQFWILAAILMITALVVWWMGTGALAEQFKKDSSTNNNAFSSLGPYKVTPVNGPPNEKYKLAVDKQNDEVGTEVVATWKTLYDRQATNLTINSRVGEALGKLALLDVNERAAEFARNGDKISFDLQNFHNGQVIEQEFKQLFDMLNLRRPKAAEAAAPGAVPAVPAAAVGEGPGVEGVVVWAAPRGTQQVMQRYKTTKTPTPDRFAVTQEDIWIFKAIFGVIQKINLNTNDQWLGVMNGNPLPEEKPIIDQANVPIKRIEFCDVAQYAMSKAYSEPGRLTALGKEKNDNAIFMNAGDGGVFSVGTNGDPEEDKQLLTNRYLDSRNFPVANAAQPPISEFRQVFLQLTVLMDQRLVPVLISEFAQAPFPIETRQVRMSLTEVDVPQKKDAGQIVQNNVERSPHDVSVTLRGVVYIYLKPDQKKLGKGSDKEPGNRDYGIPRPAPDAEAAPGL